MTHDQRQESWGSDFEEPKKKSRVPVLAWVIGSGCLFLILLLVVTIITITRLAGRASDPEVQWPRVAEVLPFDERPADHRIVMLWHWANSRLWLLIPRPGAHYQVVLLHVTGASVEATREVFFGHGAEVFTLLVQGRELPAARASGPPELEQGAALRDVIVNELASGPCLRLDLSQPGSEELLLFQWTELEGDEPVDEERVVRFLEPFHLERVR